MIEHKHKGLRPDGPERTRHMKIARSAAALLLALAMMVPMAGAIRLTEPAPAETETEAEELPESAAADEAWKLLWSW